eukprot:448047-Rhodomonas_salina.1
MLRALRNFARAITLLMVCAITKTQSGSDEAGSWHTLAPNQQHFAPRTLLDARMELAETRSECIEVLSDINSEEISSIGSVETVDKLIVGLSQAVAAGTDPSRSDSFAAALAHRSAFLLPQWQSLRSVARTLQA